ncbi:MAG: DegV family protein [Candidatus Marinamargulisbacteria bacterium]
MSNQDFGSLFNNVSKGFNAPVGGAEDSKQAAAQESKRDTLSTIQKLQTKQFENPNSLNLPETKQLVQILKSNQAPIFNNMVVNMLMNLNNSILDAVAMDLLSILATELGGDPGIDISFLNQMVQRLDDVVKGSSKREVYSKAFQNILQGASTNDPTLKSTIQTILRGINKLDVNQQGMSESIRESAAKNSNNQQAIAPNVTPSSKVDVLGASNMMQIPGMDGIDDLVFEKNTLRTKDGTLKVQRTDQNSVIADIELQKDDRVVGHAKAFGTLNQLDLQRDMIPFLSAIIQVSNIQPLFFISSIVSQMLVQMGRMTDDQNMFKLAIVTDNVAALRDIDPVDYIRKVQPSDQPQYTIYEKYKELYEEGYHHIISLHLNPNLQKTYKAAIEAKKQIDSQGVDDLEITVYNTSANGVGLGLMIYELVDAIKNHYSPIEINKLTAQLVKNYRHWVCPLEFDFVKNHQWVMDLADTQKKVQMRLFHFIPVIELDRKLTIINVSYTKETAFATLMAQIDEIINNPKRKVNRICVEYRGVFREAIKMRNQIKAKAPNIKVSLQSVGSLTTQFFGPELVGICVI